MSRSILILFFLLVETISVFANNYQQGLKSLKAGQKQKAKQHFYQFYITQPNTYKAPYALYEYIKLEDNYYKTEKIFNLMKKKYPNFENLDKMYDQMATTRYLLGDYSKSYKIYKELFLRFRKSPYRSRAFYFTVKSLILLNKLSEAKLFINKYKNQLNSEKYRPKIYYLLAETYYLNKDYSKALEYYKKIVYHYPNSKYKLRSLLSIANCYKNLDQKSSAIKVLQLLKNKYPHAIEGKYAANHVTTSRKTQLPVSADEDIKSNQTNNIKIQVATMSKKSNALALVDKLRRHGLYAYINSISVKGKTFYLVMIRHFDDEPQAIHTLKRLNKLGFKAILKKG